jgi:hypothetical protein
MLVATLDNVLNRSIETKDIKVCHGYSRQSGSMLMAALVGVAIVALIGYAMARKSHSLSIQARLLEKRSQTNLLQRTIRDSFSCVATMTLSAYDPNSFVSDGFKVRNDYCTTPGNLTYLVLMDGRRTPPLGGKLSPVDPFAVRAKCIDFRNFTIQKLDSGIWSDWFDIYCIPNVTI